MTKRVIDYLKQNRSETYDRLHQFLKIPSISTDPNHQSDIKEAAQFVQSYLTDIGLDQVEIQETGGHPLVYAEHLKAEGAPTVLIYGHYDVQPVDPLELWETPPFEPTEKQGRLYARGASDDKGQVFMHLAVLEAFMKTEGSLPINVKVCIEGEEEIGSEHLYDVLEEKKEQFDADFAIISDSGMVANDQPTILYGLKGFTGLEVTLEGPENDLHSGLYGGAIKNPLMAMSQLLASMKSEDEVVLVDHFYDEVEPLTPEELKLIEQAPSEDYQTTTGVKETVSEAGFSASEHTMGRPTLEVNGLFGGYQGEGTKTIIPSTATAKLTCRLVPGQDPETIQNLLVDHIEKHTPVGVTPVIKREPLSAKAYKVDPNHELIQKAKDSYTKAFNKEAVFVRMGGSIPVVEWIDSIFDIPVILFGFGTPDDRLHSPNESFPLANFDRGVVALVDYYASLASNS
ncbi:Acetylornithine deacetylase/Succinyl-diaminopimelate desuccinylase [Pelagirhabdus alkalitolerans]|uniref:Acetylornithine deacetylase/Succinyl-diaminopimelate desuccinylase n=1 Tax=Pelagirhabdus alkalitolerans TaxID=1612202 RepID=A0A1G6N7G7_9BACI|nr:dipeptidase [Pelagirhabdus alkalitolerans]SDC63206.1 Acetylornithine deacetylase/Succinyl-diaminopimelate desuccinylase [Pelagirhabdus alkalitolerans]